MYCVVVAHPDDEALWFGGWLVELGRRGVPVCVVCLTNRDHPTRSAEFRDYCSRVGARAVMLDYPDGGWERFPERVEDLEEAVREAGADPAGLSCVITHSPHGNERPHPQHLQAWRLVKRWSAERSRPLAFFSEKRLEQVRHGDPMALSDRATLVRARASYGPVLRALGRKAAAMGRRRHLSLGLRRQLSITREARGVRAMLALTVDLPEKLSTIEAYGSQIDGLREYRALDASTEYVYLFDEDAARALGERVA
jgi:LmbE family N-acetylglucosaminyl deacetylase